MRFVWAPMPLEVAPGRPLWEAHRGQPYLVFVDESFYEFFGFNHRDGNFCHAAVGVPAVNYEPLQRQLARLLRAYHRRARQLLGHVPNEIKSSTLRRLPLRFQASFARETTHALAELGGFVAGFYTPTAGLIMERVRENLIDVADEVPPDHGNLYEAARQELLAAVGGPGQSTLITNLLFLPISAVKFMLGSFDCEFQILYDPRQGDEDRAVRDEIGTGMNMLLGMPDPLRQPNNYLGMVIDRRSEDELGLQLGTL